MSASRAFPKVSKEKGPPPPPPLPPFMLVPPAPTPPAPPPPPPPGAIGAGGSKKPNTSGKRVRIEDHVYKPKKFVSVRDRAECGFVGLQNQGATCYMNTLLQTLFMTPEFRSRMYAWKYHRGDENAAIDDFPMGDGPEAECIPLQLQKLFLLLQVSECEAIGTTDLTHSFGWSSNQAYEQQDIQELCRVLFAALDKSILQGQMRGDEDVKVVTEMYEGMLTNFIKCLTCGFKSERAEVFSDVQLQVKGMASIRDSLTAFTTPELLDGDNQYSCPDCDAKVDAEKGLKIKRVPYVLTIQLMRFDIDYFSMTRRKVNDIVTFPSTIRMDEYMMDAPEEPLDYELYSIVIHSGGAMGGHYFNYSKSFETGEWICFNDEHVSPVSTEQLAGIGLEEAIAELDAVMGAVEDGGETETVATATEADKNEGESATNNASESGSEVVKSGVVPSASERNTKPGSMATAYMLFYRKVCPAENMTEFPEAVIPDNLQAEVATLQEEFRAAKEEHQAKLDLVKLRFYSNDESPMITVHKDTKLIDCIARAREECEFIPNDLPLECIRFRAYNPFNKKPGESYEGLEDKTLDENLFPSFKAVWVEIRTPDEEFTRVGNGEIEVNIAKINDNVTRGDTILAADGGSFFSPPFGLTINTDMTIGDVKSALVPLVSLEYETIRLISLDVLTAEARIVTAEDAALAIGDLGLQDGDYLYVEPCTDHTSTDSVVVQRFEYEQNLIEISFNLPTDSERVEYDQFTTFDKRKTLRELKEQAIGPLLGLAADEFKLCRNLLSKEYKDEAATLEASDIIDGMAVYVQLGRPMKKDEYKIRVFVYDPQFEFLSRPEQPPPLARESEGGEGGGADVDGAAEEGDKHADEATTVDATGGEGEAVAAAATTTGGPPAPPPPPPEGHVTKPTSAPDAPPPPPSAMKKEQPEDEAQLRCFSHQVLELIINENATLDEIREIVRVGLEAAAAAKGPGERVSKVDLSAALSSGYTLRIREKVKSRPGVIFIPTRTLKENLPFLHDRHEIAVQFVVEEVKTDEDTLVIRTHRWYPETWSLDPEQREVYIASHGTVGDTRATIAEFSGIPIECVQMSKPLRTANLSSLRTDVLDLNWVIGDDHLNGSSPWYLRDGDLILFRDSREQPMIPDDVRASRPAERGVTITTYHDRAAEAAEAAAEAAEAAAVAASKEESLEDFAKGGVVADPDAEDKATPPSA